MNTEFKFLLQRIFLILVAGGGAVSRADTNYFSSDYTQARARFLAALDSLAAHNIKAEHNSLKLASDRHANLVIDAAYVPPAQHKKRLVILSAGIHGAEAPMGSAFELYFLEVVLPHLQRENLGVLLLHSLNPYGFVTGRRVTENNVDLNRNFFTDPNGFAAAHNAAYDKYRTLLAKEKSVDFPLLQALAISVGFIGPALSGSRAKQELVQAIAGGQYADPQGIYFGGTHYEPQVPWIGELLAKIMAGYEEVVLLDVHTGLGSATALQLISSNATNLADPWVKSVVQPLGAQDGIKVVTPMTKGFYQTSGDFIDFVYTRASPGTRVAAFTAEFGTLGDNILSQLSTSTRIILENQGFHWGYASRSVEAGVKRRFRELFIPSRPTWKARAIELTRRALTATFAAELATESKATANKKASGF